MRRRGKILVAGAIFSLGLLLLFLGGCFSSTTGSSGWDLVITAPPGSYTITARVLGPKADLYRWSWGDGATEETNQPTAVHTYEVRDIYTVTVQVLRVGAAGDGGPGLGYGTSLQPVAELTAAVDLRPAVELLGFEVIVLDPPSWYNPETWPADHYPANCNLKIYALVKYNRPGEAKVARVVWTVFDETGWFVLQQEGDPLFFPFEKFLANSCVGKMGYKVHCDVFLTTGDVLQYVKTIYAAPPNCGQGRCG